MTKVNHQCPCGLKKTYHHCCGRFIETKANAPTPELLMRSRYTAYCLKNIDYIQQTMAKKALEQFDHDASVAWAKDTVFIKLQIKKKGKLSLNQAWVEFKISIKTWNNIETFTEKSLFEKIEGRWVYTDRA